MLDLSRVQKELVDWNRDKSSGVSIELVGAELSHLAGTISGPIGTPYEGGVFRIDIRLPGQEFILKVLDKLFVVNAWRLVFIF